ncbi:MAG: CSLREA domain-containing protein [Verrucomicrobiota bacterium]
MKTEQQWRETNSLDLNPAKLIPRFGLRCCSLLAIFALVLGITPRAHGTITVTSLADSGPGSLRQAIADATPGDTVDFAVTGTITLTSGELAIGKTLTIAGPGVTNLTLDGNHASRVLSVVSGTVSISSLTITNGNAAGRGGGILNSATLTISNCCVTRCTAYSTGQSTGSGGIDNNGGLMIIDSTISKNSGTYWAGAIVNSGTLKLLRSVVTQNSGIVTGGVLNGGTISATNSTFSLNSSSGIYNSGGYFGGASTMLWLESCTVCSNYTTYYGGGCGIIDNSSSDQSHLANSIVVGNQYAQLAGKSFISDDYNLIQSTNYATITGVTTHNIYGKDPLLGPLANNGGSTMTHALLPGSPAIDHGSSGGLITDQRGQPRPVRFPAYLASGDGSDIGAYELQERPQTNWVVNGSSSNLVYTVNSTNDVDDGIPGIAHCSLREAIKAANVVSGTNTTLLNFATNVPGLYAGVTGTITLTNVLPTITNEVAILGPGSANLTVSGNNANSILQIGIPYNPPPYPNVSISGITLANGGGGYWGSGIFNIGNLTVRNCTLTNCSSTVGGAIANWRNLKLIGSIVAGNRANGGSGGGIANENGSCMISCSTISGNSASPHGGGICVNQGLVTITNSTISGNACSLSGGGIWNVDAASLSLYSSTICSNTATVREGGIGSKLVNIGNSIVSGNSAPTAPNSSGTINSLDFNLIQNTNGATIIGVMTHNIYNQDPKLGPLADLGGPTPTHALSYDSPAIDTGNSGGLTTDQRGLPRPIGSAKVEGGDGSDIGAYEADPNLRITTLARTRDDMSMEFITLLGRIYRLENGDAVTGPWNVLSNNIPGTGGALPVVDPGAANLPHRFYRGVMLQP